MGMNAPFTQADLSITTFLNLTADILADADRCVLCGMCLPHCPTYQLTGSEAESPRGRIALMAALSRGELTATPGLRAHLESCLNCRACEAMCPSKVAYGRLWRHTRELIGGPAESGHHHLADALATPGRRRALHRLLRLYQASGLQKAARRLPFLADNRTGRLLRSLPDTTEATIPPYVPARGRERGRVALFAGCTGDLFQRRLLLDAMTLLSLLGYAVEMPAGQTCCGALHLQQGDGERTRELAAQNIAAFADGDHPVVSIATGCGTLLHDYDQVLPHGEGKAFAKRVVDITVFLARCEWPETLQLAALSRRALIHESCTLRNVLRGQQAMADLLGHIPELELAPLPGNERCCGAAGSYYLDHPATADALRQPKIEAIADLKPQLLVSANIGCAMHIAAGIRDAGLAVEVIHPVSLLARQLPIT